MSWSRSLLVAVAGAVAAFALPAAAQSTTTSRPVAVTTTTAARTLYTEPAVIPFDATKLAPLEPATGIRYLGAWLDTQENATDFDTPARLNSRLGRNLKLYHFAQNIPLDSGGEAPIQLLLNASATDAMVLLTVYARNGLDQVTDASITALAQQCKKLNSEGRKVLLRFCPEMNGSWAIYGQKPISYIATWKKVFTAIHTATNDTALLWSPNSAAGYPFAGGQFSATLSSSDFLYMDTNSNGQLDALDEPYYPYYPGDDFVDWVGLSIYYYGIDFPWIANVLPPATRFSDIITGVYLGPGQPDATNPINFYNQFSTRRNKPFFVSEFSAAFHIEDVRTTPPTPIAVGAGNLGLKQAWWRQSLLNSTFFTVYPKVKGFGLFEYKKPEEFTLRDFRMTWPDSQGGTLTEFKSDLDAVADTFEWAKTIAGQTPNTAVAGATSSSSPSPKASAPSVAARSAGSFAGVAFACFAAVIVALAI
ncbi:glycoside hydrolase superfamily [Cladochytrium replicatum]|nr:glycoside hydrolase superfamily [Cladochytrium replicatum]